MRLPIPIRPYCFPLVRPYATIDPSPHKPPFPPPRHPKRSPLLSLPAFLLRQQALALYRTVIRTTHRLPKSSATRHELVSFARTEFERSRDVKDLTHVRFLLAGGKVEVENLRGFVEGSRSHGREI